MRKVAVKEMTGEAVKERAKVKAKEDLSPPLLVLPLERVFLLVSAVNRAPMALVVANCDSTSGNAVRKLQIQMQSHAVNTILERKLKR